MMKNKCVKITAIMLSVLFFLQSCQSSVLGKGEAVVSFEDIAISEGAYKYLFASVKNYYLDTYDDIEDNEDYWNSESPTGNTYAQVIDNEINQAVVNMIVAASLYDKSGYVLSEDDLKTINDTLDGVIEDFGGRGAFNNELSDFGFDDKVLKELYKIQYKYDYMLSSPFAKADDKAVEKYYNDNYICVKFIFIDKQNNYVYDENGKKTVGNDGLYATVAMSDKQKQEKINNAKALYDSLASGGDFESEYSSQKEFDMTYYPNGMYICRDNYKAIGSDTVALEAFNMNVGEIRFVEDEDYAYIVKRCELPEKAYENSSDSIQFMDLTELCEAYRFQDIVDGYSELVKKDSEIINKYSVINVDAVSY